MNWATIFLSTFYQNERCARNGGPLKIRLFQCYKEVLWIDNIDAICRSTLQVVMFSDFSYSLFANCINNNCFNLSVYYFWPQNKVWKDHLRSSSICNDIHSIQSFEHSHDHYSSIRSPLWIFTPFIDTNGLMSRATNLYIYA